MVLIGFIDPAKIWAINESVNSTKLAMDLLFFLRCARGHSLNVVMLCAMGLLRILVVVCKVGSRGSV